MAANHQQFMTVEEYLELCKTSHDVKYEYIDGHIYAMSGGTVAHQRIAFNLLKLLDEQLQSGPCFVYTSDIKVAASDSKYFFPDATISCNIGDYQDENDTVTMPHIIFEVLSESTETFDRGKKFEYYQSCPFLQEYVLISSDQRKVEIFRRHGELWTYRLYRPGQYFDLSIDIRLEVNDLYERTRVEK